jgi:hypothetical protein
VMNTRKEGHAILVKSKAQLTEKDLNEPD